MSIHDTMLVAEDACAAGHAADAVALYASVRDSMGALSVMRDTRGVVGTWAMEGTRTCIRMRWVMPGRFIMGSPPDEPGRATGEQQQEVVIYRGFWMAEWPLLNSQMGEEWHEESEGVAAVFGREVASANALLSRTFHGVGNVRAPTEEQWEYACRAGTQGCTWADERVLSEVPSSLGPTVRDLYLNYGARSRMMMAPRCLGVNPWGFRGMLGSIWQWTCTSGNRVPMLRSVREGTPWTRVVKGGSWRSRLHDCRAASRRAEYDDTTGFDVGHRPVLEVP